MTSDDRVEIIAHRGYSAVAPENTLAALEAALRAGADGIEFDVQPAACGTPVLFHDVLLGRTTNGVGPLRRRPLAQLKALDAGSWFGAPFAGERIPTLQEALTVLRGRGVRVYQDIKGYRELEDLDRIVDLTRSTGLDSATVFVSSDWVVMNRLLQVAPEIPRAYLADTRDRLGQALDRAIVDENSLLSLEVGLALTRPEKVLEAQRVGVEVMVWTVDDPDQAGRVVGLGVRRLVTNRVESLLRWRGAAPEPRRSDP